MTVAAGVAAGGAVGLGLWMVVRACWPDREPLGVMAHRLTLPPSAPPSARQRIEHMAGRLASSSSAERVRADLAVCGRSDARHAVDKLASALGLAGMPLLFTATVTAGGGASVSTPLLVLAAAALGLAGWYVPDGLVRAEAARRRRDFRHALVAYTDLVTTVLAAGAGVESALTSAAAIGDSWPFERLRDAVVRAQRLRMSPWDELVALGAEVAVPELEELASSLALAGVSGARVRQTLEAKATALRERLLADERSQAEAATERMAVPMALLLLGFVGLVAYPAFVRVMSL